MLIKNSWDHYCLESVDHLKKMTSQQFESYQPWIHFSFTIRIILSSWNFLELFPLYFLGVLYISWYYFLKGWWNSLVKSSVSDSFFFKKNLNVKLSFFYRWRLLVLCISLRVHLEVCMLLFSLLAWLELIYWPSQLILLIFLYCFAIINLLISSFYYLIFLFALHLISLRFLVL